MKRVRVGIIGCGKISGIYLENTTKRFDHIEVVACADLISERAKAQAEQYGVPRACTPEELIGDDSIDVVLNLTIPRVHAEINQAVLDAGKHVYVEKPLAVTLEEASRPRDTAASKGLCIGCAPDTFLGGGLQTCRKLIDEGVIGDPVAAEAFMAGHGHESWHPDPEFYYKPGGGPMLDMGPYYITALVSLLGPVKSVVGVTGAAFPTRRITSEPKFGQVIEVETPTHYSGTLEFAGGAIATVVMSFDVWKHTLPRIEIHGTKGSLLVPDPNSFGGPVKLFRAGDSDWTDVPIYSHGYTTNSRGVGLADLAMTVLAGGPEKRSVRASGELAYHVLETMLAFERSSEGGARVTVSSTCERPEPLPTALADGELDA